MTSKRSKSSKTSKNATVPDLRRKDEDLDSRYGKIGIPAVAAALPYCRSEVKTASDGSAATRKDEWLSRIFDTAVV